MGFWGGSNKPVSDVSEVTDGSCDSRRALRRVGAEFLVFLGGMVVTTVPPYVIVLMRIKVVKEGKFEESAMDF